MPRRVLAMGFVVIFFSVVVGLFIIAIVGQRSQQNRVYSLNNLRELGQFAILAIEPDRIAVEGPGKDAEIARLKSLATPATIPAGTLPNAALIPEERLSWVPLSLPYLNQRRQNTDELLTAIDRSVAWNSPSNTNASRTVIRCLIPTAIEFHQDGIIAAPTYYVGNGGVGADAAMLPAKHIRAGCFRYDRSTPFAEIGDGMHESILFAETAKHVGPWIQGGPSTVRTFLPASAAFGPEGQFGGIHPGFAAFGFADGAAGFRTDRMDPAILQALMTINGGTSDPVPGD